MATKQKRILPTEDPRYGDRFKIIGIQLVDIDGNYTEMMNFEVMDKDDASVPMFFKVGGTWGEWRKQKEALSDKITTGLNNNRLNGWEAERKRAMAPFLAGPKPINFRDVVALKVKYFGDRQAVIL